MGCILSVIFAIFRAVAFAFKAVIKLICGLVLFLIKIGLLLPIIYVFVGVGLWIAGNEIMTVGTTGFTIYVIGLCVLTVFCIFRSIKKAMDRHNKKYDENGKRIK